MGKFYSLLIVNVWLISCFGDCAEDVIQTSNITGRYRQKYHITAEKGWINDPNGFSFFNGEYHVFFQYYPYAASWGNTHWGHVKSKDLVFWNRLPIALTPDNVYDKHGCFSGSAIANNDTLFLFYTGSAYGINGSFYSNQNQNMATSTNGIHFEKFHNNPLIPFPPDNGDADFRDPKVWKHDDSWYLVAGNKKADLVRVVLYKSINLIHWDYVGELATSNDGSLGTMWECPDFFELDGKYVLIFSSQGMERSGDDFANFFQTGYVVGSYSYETNEFKHGGFEEIDRGHDFYAVQTMETPSGRRIAIAWLSMWESNFVEAEEGWAGSLTLPRELRLTNSGKLIQEPIPELVNLRKESLLEETFNLIGDKELIPIKSAEIIVDIELCDDTKKVGFHLDDEEGYRVLGYFDVENNRFVLDRGDGDPRRATIEPANKYTMRIFLDSSSIEIFLNGGHTTFSSRIYPKNIPTLSLTSVTTCPINVNIKIFDLMNIWLSD